MGMTPSSREEWASGRRAATRSGLSVTQRAVGSFRHIAEATRPIDVAELTALLGLNHNAVRQHLAVLEDAELAIEEIEQRRRPRRPRY